jgi:hypothetical protein
MLYYLLVHMVCGILCYPLCRFSHCYQVIKRPWTLADRYLSLIISLCGPFGLLLITVTSLAIILIWLLEKVDFNKPVDW